MRRRIKSTGRPAHGDRQIIMRFAWLPRVVEQHWIWLELYQVEQTFFDGVAGQRGYWKDRAALLINWMY